MKNIILFCSIFSFGISFSQESSICLYLFPSNESEDLEFYENIDITIFNLKDSIIKHQFFENEDIYCLENLPQGTFKLKISKINYYSVTYEKIILNENDNIELNVYLTPINSTSNLSEKAIDCSKSYDFSLSFKFFDRNLFQTKGDVKNVYSYGINYTWMNYPHKNIGFGFNWGTSYSTYNLENKNYYNLPNSLIKERYSYWKMGLTPMIRLMLFKPKDKYGLYLDLGVSYNLPIYFSYISNSNDKITITKNKIHYYNDFSIFTRIGVNQGIALTTEYRLTNFLKGSIPQAPLFQIGFDILIPEN